MLCALVFSAYWTGWVQLDYPLIGCASSRRLLAARAVYAGRNQALAQQYLVQGRRGVEPGRHRDDGRDVLDRQSADGDCDAAARQRRRRRVAAAAAAGRTCSLRWPRSAFWGNASQDAYFCRRIATCSRPDCTASAISRPRRCASSSANRCAKPKRSREQRGIDLANLAQINELIIRRMKTGVLVVDDANRVHRWNESAWALMGNPKPGQRDLGSVAPELSRRLYHWRTTGKIDNTAVALAEGAPEIIPRFTKLASERRQQRADLPRRHVAGVAPRRRTDAVVARPPVRVDRARNPQSARRDQLFGAAARRIGGAERRRQAHGRDHQQPLQPRERDRREHPAAVASRTLAAGKHRSVAVGAAFRR